MLRQSIRSTVGFFAVLGMFYTGMALGHENINPEDDICVRKGGENMVRLSAYQPQNNLFGETCEEIPAAGETYLVVDLLDLAMRDIPVSLKVFRGAANEGETIAQVDASYHPDGVISGVGMLDKGLYSLVVTAESVPPMNYHYQLRVDMVDYGKIARAWTGPAIVLLFLSWLVYNFLQSRRWRSMLDHYR